MAIEDPELIFLKRLSDRARMTDSERQHWVDWAKALPETLKNASVGPFGIKPSTIISRANIVYDSSQRVL